MKKISQRTIEAINRLSPDELESRDAIARARNGGYLCPNPDCTNGTGKHGTGITPNPKIESHTSWHCFSCNMSCNNFQLLAWHYKFDDIRSDFVALVEKICADFDIELEYDDFDGRPKRKRRKKFSVFETDDEPVSKDELKLIHEDLKASDEPLRRMYHYRSDDWRGLPLEILLRHGCRLINDWRPPSKRAKKKFSAPTPRMLIPCSDSSYLARLIIPVKSLDDDVQKCLEGKEKLHAGKKTLFNPDVLTSNEPVFAVEGYIDAMSIEHAGFKAVALGAATRGDLLVNAVAKMDGAKPQIIILLDGDDTGRKNAPIIYDELISVGCPCVVRFLAGDDDNKIDCNQILVDEGKDALSDKLQTILDDSLSELAAVEAELIAKKSQRLNDDVLNELFDGDLSDLDFANRLEMFCGNRVRWQDDERWLTYSDGLWTPRSDKNSCVLPYAHELFATMKEFAEDKKELKIAETFKTTQKQNCAITLLKGCHSIRITADDLNQHRELLNCLNCVVNLSDGKSYSHDSKLLLTQQCNAAYDENAQSELVDKFFRDIQPNDETRAGLLRWLGYCLTAETNAEKFMIWHGTGANGKGVLSEVMLALLGTYAAALNPRALLKTNRFIDGNCATTGLNVIEGRRFAISEELPLDGELDCSLVKNLSGGDQINLRHNYGEYRTVKNLCKLNLSGNYLPRLENVEDKGILRRLLNMPFSVRFGTDEHPADDQLKQKILQQENLRGLLALLVRESVAWYRRDDGGLIISDEMKAATKRHLAQNNFVLDFLTDNYQLGASLSISAKTLLDELRTEYPFQAARFKRADLINLIVNAGEGKITYCEGKDRYRIFKGVGKAFAQKQRFDDLDGEPVNLRDLPFD